MPVVNSHVPTIDQFLKKLTPEQQFEMNKKCEKLARRVGQQNLVRGYGTKIIDQNTGYTLISVYVSETSKTAYCRISLDVERENKHSHLEVVGKSNDYEGAIEAALQMCFDQDCNPVNGITTLANVYFPERNMIEVRF